MPRLIDANELAKEYQFTEDHTSPLTSWTITDILNILDEAPTVDAVEVVHGRWIYEKDTVMVWTTKAICSACKCVVAHNTDLSHEYGIEKHEKRNKYCPECGAKMDGDGNE